MPRVKSDSRSRCFNARSIDTDRSVCECRLVVLNGAKSIVVFLNFHRGDVCQ